MKSAVSRAVSLRALIFFALCLCCFTNRARAQTNSWTNSASGNWQDPYWSLGELPGTNQAILFTNAGSKTLTIDSSTVQSFPDTLSIGYLTVSAPAGSSNMLVLTNAEFETPISGFTIGSNSAAQMYSSSFNCYEISVGGVLAARDSYLYDDGNFYLGAVGPGVFSMTNSVLDAAGFGMVESLGAAFPGTFNQQGGTNFAADVSVGAGEYNLFDGVLANPYGAPVFIGLNGGTFNQFGGNVSANVVIRLGSYHLAGGILFSGDLNIPSAQDFSDGSLWQSGGTNFAGGITLGNGGGPGGYNLSGGVLIATNLVVQDHYLGGNPGEDAFKSVFSQSGGFNTNNGVEIYDSSYELSGGILATSSNYLEAGVMTQSGGTNQVGDLLMTYESTYSLSNGWLMAQNITLQDYGVSIGLGYTLSIFQQSGGTNQIDGDLVVGGAIYELSGGELVAPNISVNYLAVFHHEGGTLLPGTLTFGGGTWSEETGGAQLGQLLLSTNNSFLSLPTHSCVLQFADSSSLVWTNGSLLRITNWSGSLYGGGQQQIIFGSNSTALTPQQLAQIQFQNPAGLLLGTYPARILSTGEIVPDTGAPLPLKLNFLKEPASDTMHLSIGGDIGQTYAIEVSTDLVHWNTWTDQFNTSGTMIVDDNDTANCPQKFYRAHLMP